MSLTKLLSILRARNGIRLIALVWNLGFCSAGCVTLLPYQPNDQILDTLGVDVARERLRETLLRAVSPRLQNLTLTNEFVQWHPGGAQIYFVNLDRVDVFENHVVHIRGAGNQILGTIVYGTDQDAKIFADLLMGFRKRYYERRHVLTLEHDQAKERLEDTVKWKQAHYKCLKESETHYMGMGWGIFIAKAQAEKVQKEKYTACMGAHGY